MSNSGMVDVSDVVITQEVDPVGASNLAVWRAVLHGQTYRLYETMTDNEFLFSPPSGVLTHVKMGLICLYFKDSNDLMTVEPLFVAYAILEALTPVVKKYLESDKEKLEKDDATFVAEVPSNGDWDLF